MQGEIGLGDLLLQIKNLKTYFYLDEGTVRAVDGIDLTVEKGETVGIVGESGCGKTVAAQSILQIMPEPGKIVAGEINYYPDNHKPPVNLARLNPKKDILRRIRGNEISFIFQEPMTAFSPVHTIGNQIMESFLIHNKEMGKRQARAETITILKRVGIPDPGQRVDAYPFQLSGGMRQRAMIAMALSCNPKLLIADEPTTSLDVTVQAQILALLKALQEKYGMSILIITHDLAIVAEMASKVAVMYMGKLVEKGNIMEIYDNPAHPYTKALLDSLPAREKDAEYLKVIKGSVPDPYTRLVGCEFAPRCEEAIEGICDKEKPSVTEVADGHLVWCFLYSDQKEGLGNVEK